jgi:hypothetical protein
MGNNVEVRELEKEQYSEWDRLVLDSPQGTLFHNTKWLTLFDEVLGGQISLLGCYKKEELIGGCAVRIYRKGIFKVTSSSLYSRGIIPYDGVIIKYIPENIKARKKEKYHNEIYESLIDRFRSNGFSFVRLINSPEIVDIRTFKLKGWEDDVLYTYKLKLREIDLMEFSRDERKSIKKASKEGITVERSNDSLCFLRLYKSMLARKNVAVPSAELGDVFSKIISQELGGLWIAKTSSNDIVAGEIILFDEKRAYRWMAASDELYWHTGGASLLFYNILQEIKDRTTEIDLIGATSYAGGNEFKMGFNPQLVPYYMVLKSTALYDLAKRTSYLLHRFRQ